MHVTLGRAAHGEPRRTAVGAPWPPSSALLAAYAGAAGVTAVAVLAGGDRHPAVALAGYALLAAFVCLLTRPLVTPAVAAIAWLFDDGFLIGRHAVLAWPGAAGGWRLVILLAAAAVGSALGAAVRARAVSQPGGRPAPEDPAASSRPRRPARPGPARSAAPLTLIGSVGTAADPHGQAGPAGAAAPGAPAGGGDVQPPPFSRHTGG